MDEHRRPTRAPATEASSTTEEILAVTAAEEPHGTTADHVARTIGLGGAAIRGELEELVARGLLDRRGRGAVYTLAATGATADHASGD